MNIREYLEARRTADMQRIETLRSTQAQAAQAAEVASTAEAAVDELLNVIGGAE